MIAEIEKPVISPERAATLRRLHFYIAGEIAGIVGDQSRAEINGHKLLTMLTDRATDEALNCGEWPREPLHLRLAIHGAKEPLKALGINAKQVRRRTASGKYIWKWRLRNDALEASGAQIGAD